MCVSPLISPLGSLFGGGKSASTGLAMLSPAAALGSALFAKKTPAQPDRLTALYPNGG
jgi:hypothetical protein